MKLNALVAGLCDPEFESEQGESHVTGFAIDHRKIAPGNIFGAFRGARFNGEDYIEAAIAAGAIAIVAGPQAKVSGAVHLSDEDPRRLFALLAARYFTPVPQVVAAVTGTNGKTSTAELTRQLWRMDGLNSASIGTLGVTTADEQVKTGLTTPDIVTFLSNMSGLAREGVSHAIFEASSHGLSQYRTEGLPVQVGVFTNLIWIITAIWTAISKPRCGCLTKWSKRAEQRLSGPTTHGPMQLKSGQRSADLNYSRLAKKARRCVCYRGHRRNLVKC